jgi:hypothetical protein
VHELRVIQRPHVEVGDLQDLAMSQAEVRKQSNRRKSETN